MVRQTADVLLTKIETMPPAAPGSLGAEKHVDLLAYLMSQNQLVASDTPLPTDIDRLKTMLLPGATGGPSGGFSPKAILPSAPHVVNPRTRLNDVPSSAPITYVVNGRQYIALVTDSGGDVSSASAGDQESPRPRRDAVGVRATQTRRPDFNPRQSRRRFGGGFGTQ